MYKCFNHFGIYLHLFKDFCTSLLLTKSDIVYKPVAFPVFDSQVAFDNDQVVGRSWQVCMYPVREPKFFSYVPKRESLFPNRASPLFSSSRTGITDYQKKKPDFKPE